MGSKLVFTTHSMRTIFIQLRVFLRLSSEKEYIYFPMTMIIFLRCLCVTLYLSLHAERSSVCSLVCVQNANRRFFQHLFCASGHSVFPCIHASRPKRVSTRSERNNGKSKSAQFACRLLPVILVKTVEMSLQLSRHSFSPVSSLAHMRVHNSLCDVPRCVQSFCT